jgi:hypothetical protein
MLRQLLQQRRVGRRRSQRPAGPNLAASKRSGSRCSCPGCQPPRLQALQRSAALDDCQALLLAGALLGRALGLAVLRALVHKAWQLLLLLRPALRQLRSSKQAAAG